jgi:hypothetical protein
MKEGMRQRLDRLQRSLPDRETHDAAVEAASEEAMRHLTDDDTFAVPFLADTISTHLGRV